MSLLSPSTIELRRERAVLQDIVTCETTSLVRLWRSLRDSEAYIGDAFVSSERCYLLLETKPSPAKPMTELQRYVLEHILTGGCQNFLAIDLRLAASTVALHSRAALRAIGLSCKPSRSHPLPMLAAMASLLKAEDWRAASSTFVHDEQHLRVVSVTRPEAGLVGALPPAELEVVRGLVEGLSYKELSQRRQTSVRTVANQVSSVFRRFGVSGRNELVCHLWAAAMRGSSTVPPASQVAGTSGEGTLLGSQCA